MMTSEPLRKRVLWIEDEAMRVESKHFAPAVYISNRYTMRSAISVLDGIAYIQEAIAAAKPYSAIVIDIRFGYGPNRVRAGWDLLRVIYGVDDFRCIVNDALDDESVVMLRQLPKDKIGVFSVEDKDALLKSLIKLGIELPSTHVVHKRNAEHEALLSLFDKLTEQL